MTPRTPFENTWGFEWKKRLGDPAAPYALRWMARTPWFSVRLHHWLGSDDLRWPHDHPYSFLTVVLRGAYDDVQPASEGAASEGAAAARVDRLRAGSVRFRRAEHRHSVRLVSETATTLVITGPERREWGFWVKNKFRRHNKYFFEWGHH